MSEKIPQPEKTRTKCPFCNGVGSKDGQQCGECKGSGYVKG